VSADGALVYVSDPYNNRVQKYRSDGAYIEQWDAAGSANGQFNFPRGLAVDGDGSVYVADGGNNRVQKFDAAGDFQTAFTASAFQFPNGIALDADGNLYVANLFFHNIVKFAPNGSVLARVEAAGYGAGVGQLWNPAGIAVSPDGGRIYVAEELNNRVQGFARASFSEPIATIIAASPRKVALGQPIAVRGRGGDSVLPIDVTGYEWSLDGVVKETTADASLSTAGLAPGVHTVSFRVSDSRGNFSAPQSFTITVDPPAPDVTWTMLLYLDGDTGGDIAPALGRDPGGALDRLAQQGLPANVRVFALYDGPESGDSIYYAQQPGAAPQVLPQGELNMGDPQTLTAFVAAGLGAAPADRYYLAIADHANGLDGIAWDYTSGPQERLTNPELREALLQINALLGRPIDVLHFDACLMGLLENAYQARGLASYLVVSQNLAWSAFAYDSYSAAIGPQTSPRALALAVVDRYAQRMGQRPYTIAALDLVVAAAAPSKLDLLANATNALAERLKDYVYASPAQQEALANLRAQAQKFDSRNTYQLTEDQEYIDLGHLASLIAGGIPDSQVQASAQAVEQAIEDAVIAERHASGLVEEFIPDTFIDLEQARGVAIYFPQQRNKRTFELYAQELGFAQETLWGEFLLAQFGELAFENVNPDPIPAPPLALPPPDPTGPTPTEPPTESPSPSPTTYRVRLPLLR
jgi:hypothetical protein